VEAHDQHESFIKTPQQLIVVILLSFLVPVIGIVLLVQLVLSRPSADPQALTAESVAALARRHGVDMPITLAVDQVLNHGAGVAEAVARLLAHPYHYDRITVPSKEAPEA